MSDTMAQEEAMNMSNEQAAQILIPMRDMMCDQNGCPISDAVFALDKAIEALSADRPSEIIYGNEHNCIMTIFGKCSYAETGCGDCAVVEKVRKALSADRLQEWIPCSERMPKAEEKVWIQTERGKVCFAMYEDGTISENDSACNWYDLPFDKWDEENDCGIIPEGWWEWTEFHPDNEFDCPVDEVVVAWMPLPEPWRDNEQ